jgi:hypothetical protein
MAIAAIFLPFNAAEELECKPTCQTGQKCVRKCINTRNGRFCSNVCVSDVPEPTRLPLPTQTSATRLPLSTPPTPTCNPTCTKGQTCVHRCHSTRLGRVCGNYCVPDDHAAPQSETPVCEPTCKTGENCIRQCGWTRNGYICGNHCMPDPNAPVCEPTCKTGETCLRQCGWSRNGYICGNHCYAATTARPTTAAHPQEPRCNPTCKTGESCTHKCGWSRNGYICGNYCIPNMIAKPMIANVCDPNPCKNGEKCMVNRFCPPRDPMCTPNPAYYCVPSKE